ncbi:penicillin acylase family protein [Pseudomonas sp. MG-9]|uniref:Acyl-homoserine lactone acylase QuiP n=1 Tax=Pseudomonas serboccidentalis TaxID=2964670 RepID=A0ABY7ZD43_9PSED|nr:MULTISPECIES: penicillin acylase family protein [Pseudomonas]MBT9268257.1 penicillin acylase family protein [Pseudomonas sp. MG-9]WDR37639.1 penicillin acylase family protein [Pseudomonas serboccidentalis]
MKTMSKTLLFGTLGVFGIGLVGVMYVLHNITLSNVFATGILKVSQGLSEKGTIAWDANAVPHIKAANDRDAYFLLGYSHARDRLWQMQFSKNYANGTLSETFGSKTLEMDKFSRTLGFRKTADSIYQQLNPDTRDVLQSYSDGVNYFIDKFSDRLPVEFALTRSAPPNHWQPSDSVALHLLFSWTLSSNLGMQLQRLSLSKDLTVAQINEVFAPYPGSAAVKTRDYAALYRTLDVTDTGMALLDKLPPSNVEGVGSNNWVISGEHTASGKPILANDPHLRLTNPALFYLASIETAKSSLVGATYAGAPLFVIGHNKKIAWGYTNTGSSVQDAYLEKVNPGDASLYLGSDSTWQPFQIAEETINVKGEDPVRLAVRATRHGPVISDIYPAAQQALNGKKSVVIALAWTGLDTRDKTFDSILGINRAENWQQFLSASADFGLPPQNMVYGDTAGNIGYVSAGRVPVKAQDNDLLGQGPAPGWEGKYDWTGYVPESAKPKQFNPPIGYIATANNRIVPDNYAFNFGHDWVLPYRYDRIMQLLKAHAPHTLQTSADIQLDRYSTSMSDLLPKMMAPLENHPAVSNELSILKAWRFDSDPDSAAPLIAAYWVKNLTQALLEPKIGKELLAAGWNQRNYDAFLNLLLSKQADQAFWCGAADCQRLLEESLVASLRQIKEKYGDQVSGWHWGQAHQAVSEHVPLHKSPAAWFFDNHNAVGGDNFTVNVGRYNYSDPVNPFNTNIAATFRMVADLSDLDNSSYILSSSNTGIKFNGYVDMNRLWARGDYVKIPVARQMSESHALRFYPDNKF